MPIVYAPMDIPVLIINKVMIRPTAVNGLISENTYKVLVLVLVLGYYIFLNFWFEFGLKFYGLNKKYRNFICFIIFDIKYFLLLHGIIYMYMYMNINMNINILTSYCEEVSGKTLSKWNIDLEFEELL